MAAIYARHGPRCQDHPHRRADERCDGCGQPFCVECLSPSERDTAGARDWFCPKCVWLNRERRERAQREQSLDYRLSQAARRTRLITLTSLTATLLLAASTAIYFTLARRFGTAASPQALAERAASCGELSRIRSVGAIGAPAPDDAVNVLSYPHRAQVRLLPPAIAATAPPDAAGASDLKSIVDECVAGWRSPPQTSLPLTLEIEVGTESSAPVQRISLWQNSTAPRASWIRDFELLASPNPTGEDFHPLSLDRAPRLEATEEPQWFAIVQAQAMGLTLDRLARGGAQATGTDPQPEVAQVRRLRLRVLSTYGDASAVPQPFADQPLFAARDGIALGEIAAYGPDQELSVGIVCASVSLQGQDSCVYGFKPTQIRALAGRPRFVYFVNDTDVAHTFTTVGQDKDVDVRVGPGQSASIVFTAASRGITFDFYCRIADHAAQGMHGRIVIR